MQEKKKTARNIGILSIVASLVIPVVGIVLGVLAIIEANTRQKESGLDYKTERILAIVGLILGILIYFGYGYRHSEIEVKEK